MANPGAEITCSHFRIGVLGGIGPESTGEFYARLIRQLQNEGMIKGNCDFPQIFINSIPAPELIRDKICDEELEPYIAGLKELDGLGVDFIVMVCNTIHLFYGRLQGEVAAPILDLQQELKKALIEKGLKSILVIGTPGTIQRGLYRFDGFRCLEPNKKEMEQLSSAIHEFNRGDEREKCAKNVKIICRKYLDVGAEAVVLGCTEFAVMLGNEDMPKINTLEVLADAVIRKIRENPFKEPSAGK